MEANAIGSLSAYTFQSSLNQSGSSSRAMAQSLASGQSQVADVVTLLGREGSTDPEAAVDRSPSRLPLAKLYTPAPTSEGIGPSIEQNAQPRPAAAQPAMAGAAQARYAYDQSQNPNHTAAQAAAAGQQSQLASGLNLLA